MYLSKFAKIFLHLKNSFLIVIILIQCLLITLSIQFSKLTVDVLDKNQKEKDLYTVKNINNSIHSATENPKPILISIAKNKAIISAFAKRDRKLLLEESNYMWSELKKLGFKQFQFHILEGSKYVTFLRVHQPENFGDDLSYRPMVMKSNLTNELLSGLEQGKSGYGFRTIMPIIVNGKSIGSVELGSNFGEEFLNQVNVNFPGNWAIYNFARGVSSVDDRILISKLGEDIDGPFKNLVPNEKIMSFINTGEVYFESSKEKNMSSIYVPVKNFLGDNALMLKYVFPTSYFKTIDNIFKTTVIICLIGLLLSGLIIYVLHRLISFPIRKLVNETEKIRNFQLDDEMNYSSSLNELNDLIDSVKNMKKGLQSFKKYVPAQLVRQLIQTNQEAIIGGQRKELTIFFSDVANFTKISEQLTPNELTSQLSEYLSVITDIIIKHQGTVDKYVGDAVIAFWGAPIDLKNHAVLAAKAALECQNKCKELNQKWASQGKQAFETRIGINSGEIIVGNMGSEQRLNYTIIGDEVNLASRLEGLNKVYGTNILLSQNTVELLPTDFALRHLDFVIVAGKTKPVSIFELVAEKGDVKSIDLELLKSYNEAIALYKNKKWDEAVEIFSDILKLHPDDKASLILTKRCHFYKQNPPPVNWKGEYVHNEK